MKKMLCLSLLLFLVFSAFACAVPNSPTDISPAPIGSNTPNGTTQPTTSAGNTPPVTGSVPIATISPESDIEAFVSNDLTGKSYNQTILADSTLTMINFWATWCQPCVNELPELQKISNDFTSKNVALYGVLLDSNDSGAIEQAKTLVNNAGVLYPILERSASLNESIVVPYDISSMPTTLFIDAQGSVLKVEVGAHSYDEWAQIIDSLLKGM